MQIVLLSITKWKDLTFSPYKYVWVTTGWSSFSKRLETSPASGTNEPMHIYVNQPGKDDAYLKNVITEMLGGNWCWCSIDGKAAMVDDGEDEKQR